MHPTILLLAPRLFALDPGVRYVAVNQGGRIVEMTQRGSAPTNNPHETDRLEELFVNPAVLDLTRRRGELDLDGVRYVVIRYGPMFQLVLPFGQGHVSVGLELSTDPVALARQIAEMLGLRN